MEGVNYVASEKGVARMTILMLVCLLLAFRSLAVPNDDHVYLPGSPSVPENDDHYHPGSLAVPDNHDGYLPGTDAQSFLATLDPDARYPVCFDKALSVYYVEIHSSTEILQKNSLFFEYRRPIDVWNCVGYIVGIVGSLRAPVVFESHYREYILIYRGSYHAVDFRNQTHVLRPPEKGGSRDAGLHDPVIDDNAGYPVLVGNASDPVCYYVDILQRGQLSESGIQYFKNADDKSKKGVAGIIKSALGEKGDVVLLPCFNFYILGLCRRFYAVKFSFFFTKYRLSALLLPEVSIDELPLRIGCIHKPKAQQMATEKRPNLVLYEVLLRKDKVCEIDLGSEVEYCEREACYLEFRWNGIDIRQQEVFEYIDSKAGGNVHPMFIRLVFDNEGPYAYVRAKNGNRLRTFIPSREELRMRTTTNRRMRKEKLGRWDKRHWYVYDDDVKRVEARSNEFVPIEKLRRWERPINSRH